MFGFQKAHVFALAVFAGIASSGTAAPVLEVVGNDVFVPPGNAQTDLVSGTNFGSAVANTLDEAGHQSRNFLIINDAKVAGQNLVLQPPIKVSGTNAGDFAVVTQPSISTVGPGSSVSFEVTFSPKGLGVRTATLTIDSNDQAVPAYNIAVSGTGVSALSPVPDLGVLFITSKSISSDTKTGLTKVKVQMELSNNSTVKAQHAVLSIFSQADFPFRAGSAHLLKQKRIRKLGASLSGELEKTVNLKLKVPSNEAFVYFLLEPEVQTEERSFRDNFDVASVDVN
jgi:hypothetical protein